MTDFFLPERVPRPPRIGVAGNASSSTSEPGPSAASNVDKVSFCPICSMPPSCYRVRDSLCLVGIIQP